MQIRNNWLSWYDFRTGNTLVDSTGNGNTLTQAGTPTFITGGGKPNDYVTAVFSTSIRFANTNNNSTFNFTNGTNDLPFTICAWINPTNVTGLKAIMGKRNSNTTPYEWAMFLNGANIFIDTYSNNGITAYLRGNSLGTSLTAGNWYFIVASYNGSGVGAGAFTMWINGVPQTVTNQSSGSYTRMSITGVAVGVGATADGTSASFNGGLDGIGIRSGGITQDEVDYLYNNGNGRNPFSPDTSMMQFF